MSADEAEAFISNVLQCCINLMHINNGRELMTEAIACVRAWLKVAPLSNLLPRIHTDSCAAVFQGEDISSPVYSQHLVARLRFTDAHRQQFPPVKFLPALERLSQAHNALEEQQDWLQPKGVGVVCIKDGGLDKGSFVHFYFGKMYGQYFNLLAHSPDKQL